MLDGAYQQYVHTLGMAYRQYAVDQDKVAASIEPFSALESLTRAEVVTRIAERIRLRLDLLPEPLGHQIIETPFIRSITFDDITTILIPILNQQGIEWYSEAPHQNFDFTVERKLGLLDGAKVIYDFGGHHGVWAAYYAKTVGDNGYVYSYEPSILNVEISSLLFLINDLANVVNTATAVGTHTHHGVGASDASKGMLIDFVSDDIRVIDVRSIAWHKADFLKMDIEGFEYDLLTECPWIFDLATNMHIELHIPHLERRSLDYRDVTRLLPFDEFEVHNSHGLSLEPVTADTPLSGYCSLMMKRR
jgi:FkbM family methyltransferase